MYDMRCGKPVKRAMVSLLFEKRKLSSCCSRVQEVAAAAAVVARRQAGKASV